MSDAASPDEPALPELIRLPDTRRALWLRAVMALGALVCFVLGIVFWLTPVVTGLPFYLLGAVLLGMASPSAARRLNVWETRLPRRVRLWLRPRYRRARAQAAQAAAAEETGDEQGEARCRPETRQPAP